VSTPEERLEATKRAWDAKASAVRSPHHNIKLVVFLGHYDALKTFTLNPIHVIPQNYYTPGREKVYWFYTTAELHDQL